MTAPEVRTERSMCRVCACLCGVLIDIQGDQVLRVRGDRDHPLSRGYSCPKGRALPRMHHHPNRIERPMMRIDGELKAVSWDHALDDLSTRLRTVVDRYGPASVGAYFGSGLGMDAPGFSMAFALTEAIGTPARFTPLTIDHAGKILAQTLMTGSPRLYPRADYDHVRLLIYAGSNPMVSHGHPIAIPNPARMLKAASARGELWVIDPHRTETAALATRHVSARPGADYAIFGYLVREVLRAGVDPEVLARTQGVEALREAVEPFTLERAADLAGVPAEDLSDLLAAVRKAGRVAVEIGTGVTMAARTANVSAWFGWALMILTDSMNRRGGMWFHPGFFKRIDAEVLPLVTEPFAPGPKSRPDLQSFVGDWPCAAVPDEIEAGNMHAFLNYGGAIMRSFPDANALGAALAKLDVFLTLDIIESETTRLSTHVLPTKDYLERPEVVLWDHISPKINAHFTPALVEPVGERRASWWVLAEVMKRMGYEPPFALPADPFAPGADEQVMMQITAGARCSFEELAAQRYVDVSAEHDDLPAPWIEAHIARFGGWKLSHPVLLEQLAAVLAMPRPRDALVLTPRRQRRHLNATFTYVGDTPDVLLNPADAQRAGVADGQAVVIRSGRGQITGLARIDDKLRPGVVSAPHGFEEANVNFLTSTEEVDPVTGMAVYGAFPVTVEPA
jgi:anaerobic selenocysteine-containing dehydrogenase